MSSKGQFFLCPKTRTESSRSCYTGQGLEGPVESGRGILDRYKGGMIGQ